MFSNPFSFIIVFLFLLAGCVTTASWQEKNYEPKRSGVVSYLLDRNIFDPEIVQKRRMDAKQKMRHFCKPKKYQVVSEKTKEEKVGYTEDTRNYGTTNNNSFSKNIKEGLAVAAFGKQSSFQNTTGQIVERRRLFVHFICQ